MKLTPAEETLLFRAAKHHNVSTSKLILLALAQSSDLSPADYFNALVCLRKLAKDTSSPSQLREIAGLIRHIEQSERVS